MALRNQPYFPLYVDDYLTDEKLNLCSASTQGVYIKILCILHKQDEYGKLLLKQKDKHLPEICLNFAYKLARLLPFTEDIIHSALVELLEEKVLYIENDYLCQKRMIKDEIVSKKRAESGSKGGKKTQFALASALAKSEANSVNEYVNENVNKDITKPKVKKEYTFPETILMKISKPEKVWKEYHLQHIPVTLHNETFILNWVDWIDHLISKKKKPTENAAKRQLEKLSKVDDPNLWLNTAIEHGWQGLFPPPETKVIRPTSEPAWMK